MLFFLSWLFSLLVLVTASCGNQGSDDKTDQEKGPDKEALREALLEANKSAVESEREMIRNYARRHRWPIEQEKGIYYTIYEKGSGKAITHGSEVAFHYTLSLINGTEVASSERGNPEHIQVGVGGEEIGGLHRAMLLLGEGDKAKVIIPSHLAYGLAGDQKKIPSMATLIYDLHILQAE
jgi:FKBP-type peptidyl-prolyl cis-trans isomerase